MLADWCKRKKIQGFYGVVPSDGLPTNIWRPRNLFLIINHSPSTSPTGGTHWLGCRINNQHAYWFDSYGLNIDSPLESKLMGRSDGPTHFLKWLRSIGVTKITYNTTDFQSVASEVCGLYACYFGQNGLPQQNPVAWQYFGSSKIHNDQVIQMLVRINPNLQQNKTFY